MIQAIYDAIAAAEAQISTYDDYESAPEYLKGTIAGLREALLIVETALHEDEPPLTPAEERAITNRLWADAGRTNPWTMQAVLDHKGARQ